MPSLGLHLEANGTFPFQISAQLQHYGDTFSIRRVTVRFAIIFKLSKTQFLPYGENHCMGTLDGSTELSPRGAAAMSRCYIGDWSSDVEVAHIHVESLHIASGLTNNRHLTAVPIV